MGILLVAGFGVGLEANEIDRVRRTSEIGQQHGAIPIESLPLYRPAPSASANDDDTGRYLSLERAIRATAALQDHSASLLGPSTFLQDESVSLQDYSASLQDQSASLQDESASLQDESAFVHDEPALLQDQPESEQDPADSRVAPRDIRAKLKRGQSISSVLRAQGVSPRMVRMIDRAMRPKFDFRHAQPGNSFRMRLDEEGELASFRYRISPDEVFVLRPSANGYIVERELTPLRSKLARMHGKVAGSLYTSIRKMGHDPVLASAFADIFAWDIDFTRQVKAGDGFTILYERLYREEEGEEVFVRPGRILAAQIAGSVGEHTAVYFEERDGVGHYFRPDGETLEQEYLVAPLKYRRVSSKYSAARNHPILKVVRPHHGIDYAASTGTPIWSVADGTVIFRGANGGFGNLVKIRHKGGFVSYYAHMSAFSPGLRVGQTVRQQQVIGYVGQTGLATGPHVCFRVTKNGVYVNPATLNRQRPFGRTLVDASWDEFQLVRDQLLASMYEGRSSEFAGNAL